MIKVKNFYFVTITTSSVRHIVGEQIIIDS